MFLIAAAITLSWNGLKVNCFPLKSITPEVESSSGDENQPLPSFVWDIDTVGPPFKLTVDFNDGNDPDVAVLFPKVYDGVEEPCILAGSLTNEPNVDVAVNGCPSDDSFNVSKIQ